MLWPAKIAKLEGENAALIQERDAARAEATGFQERLTALEAAGENSPALLTANAEVSRLLAENGEQTTQLEAAFARIKAFEASTGTDGHFTFGSDAAKPIVALTDKGKTALVNAGITRELAATGHKPLPIGGAVDSAGGATGGEEKLSARERLKAETRAEFAARAPQKAA